MISKLPPLNLEDDSYKEVSEIKFIKCVHDFDIITTHEIKCKKCGVGYTGEGVTALVNNNLDSSTQE